MWPGPGNDAYFPGGLLSRAQSSRSGARSLATHAARTPLGGCDAPRPGGARTFHLLADSASSLERRTVRSTDSEINCRHSPTLVTPDLTAFLLGDCVTTRVLLMAGRIGTRPAGDVHGAGTTAPSPARTFEVARLGARCSVPGARFRLQSVCGHARLIAGGALALCDRIGTLAPGQPADLIVVDTSSLHHEPINDPWATVGWFANGPDVSTVIARGAVILDDGEFTTVDEAEVRARGLAAARGVLARL